MVDGRKNIICQNNRVYSFFSAAATMRVSIADIPQFSQLESQLGNKKLRPSVNFLEFYYPPLEEIKDNGFDPGATIFFMIGSQRSGSNWLRTMLGEREDLAGPHPPHIMREFMPILSKYGDLEIEENLEILIDHVCTFVERNQVPWLDKHGRKIKFDRQRISDVAESTVEILRVVHEDKDINQNYYLLAVMDEIYNIAAIENDKRTWVCKSMGMSQYYDMLVTFYSEERLRFIYLVRDPRDVGLSFMKTPVGDCHYYAILKKWAKLQNFALKILSADVKEEMVHQVRYESLLTQKDLTLEELNEFIGKRRFGAVMRRGSVQILKDLEDVVAGASKGHEAKKAAVLSYQFKNLTRGESFAKTQFQKWRGALNDDELHLIESVAFEEMSRLGYEPHVAGASRERLEFSKEDIAEFDLLNQEGIKKMMDDLEKENPEDAARRKLQADVLKAPLEIFKQDEEKKEEDIIEHEPYVTEAQKMYPYQWPAGAGTVGYIETQDVRGRFSVSEEKEITLPEGFKLRFSTATQRGYYPSDPDKANQDAFLADTDTLPGDKKWFAVYDGHGPTGDECARFACDEVIHRFTGALKAGSSIQEALTSSHLETNDKLINDSDINAEFSGTTAVTLLMDGLECHISNLGDSRCIVASETEKGGLESRALTQDQTPYRKDELERIKAAGGLVMTSDQYDGTEPKHENWSPKDDLQPRIWSKDGKFPGTAFTRSIGDYKGELVGCYAQPEFSNHTISEKDKMLIVGSDGIFEFISDKEVVSIGNRYSRTEEVCRALVGESYKRWIKKEDRTDDITCIVCFVSKDGKLR